MSKVYVVGESFERDGETFVAYEYDECDLTKLFVASHNHDELDAAMDEVYNKFSTWKARAIASVASSDEGIASLKTKWAENRSFGVSFEEGVYGFGDTKGKAKASYVDTKLGDVKWE